MIVLFSGAFFNFLSAIIFCFILLVSFGFDIMQIKEDPTIYQGQLYKNDVIYQVNGVDINFATNGTMSELITSLNPDNSFSLTVRRYNETTKKYEMVVVENLYLQNKLNSNIEIYNDPITGNQFALAKNQMFTEEEYNDLTNAEIYENGEFKEGITVFRNEINEIVYVISSTGVYDETAISDKTNTNIYAYNTNGNPIYAFPTYGLYARPFFEAL